MCEPRRSGLQCQPPNQETNCSIIFSPLGVNGVMLEKESSQISKISQQPDKALHSSYFTAIKTSIYSSIPHTHKNQDNPQSTRSTAPTVPVSLLWFFNFYILTHKPLSTQKPIQPFLFIYTHLTHCKCACISYIPPSCLTRYFNGMLRISGRYCVI